MGCATPSEGEEMGNGEVGGGGERSGGRCCVSPKKRRSCATRFKFSDGERRPSRSTLDLSSIALIKVEIILKRELRKREHQ